MFFDHGLVSIVRRQGSFAMRNTTLETTKTIERVLFAFAGIALYNMIELFVQIAFRFKSWKGLYFWSLIISTLGILPYTLGLLFKFFGVIQGYPLVFLAITMIDVGWQMMVTGQSFVLYSRLHLICRSEKIQRAVLWMIIANWFISNVPTTVFIFAAASPQPERYDGPYGVWERLQLCLYFVQEVIISCIYGTEVIKMLKPELFGSLISEQGSLSGKTTSSANSFERKMHSETSKRVLRHLLWINVVIIALDITLLVIEFIGHYEVQVLYKGFVYSAKLKMEFRILNQLTDIAQARLRSTQAYFGGAGNGSSGSHWEPLSMAETGCPRRKSSWTTAVSPLALTQSIGVLPGLEEQASEASQKDGNVLTVESELGKPIDLPLRHALAPILTR
jgi:hypothetical protein